METPSNIVAYDFGFNDFPGRYAMTLYFRGCQLRCPFCHNQAIVDASPEHSIDVPHLAEAYDAMQKTMPNQHIGLVLSGGEPIRKGGVHRETMKDLMDAFNWVPLCVHTNGLARAGGLIPTNLEYVVLGLKTVDCMPDANFEGYYIERVLSALDKYSRICSGEIRKVRTESLTARSTYIPGRDAIEQKARTVGWNSTVVDDTKRKQKEDWYGDSGN